MQFGQLTHVNRLGLVLPITIAIHHLLAEKKVTASSRKFASSLLGQLYVQIFLSDPTCMTTPVDSSPLFDAPCSLDDDDYTDDGYDDDDDDYDDDYVETGVVRTTKCT